MILVIVGAAVVLLVALYVLWPLWVGNHQLTEDGRMGAVHRERGDLIREDAELDLATGKLSQDEYRQLTSERFS